MLRFEDALGNMTIYEHAMTQSRTWTPEECFGLPKEASAEIARLTRQRDSFEHQVDLKNEGLREQRHEIERLQKKTASDEAALGAIAVWLEQHQPDVFRRGLWDAITQARKGPFELSSDEPSAPNSGASDAS